MLSHHPLVNTPFYFSNSLNWLLYSKNNEPRKPLYQLTSHGGLVRAAILGHGIIQLPLEWVISEELALVEVLPGVLEVPRVDLFFIYNKKYAKIKRLNALYTFLYKCFNEE